MLSAFGCAKSVLLITSLIPLILPKRTVTSFDVIFFSPYKW